VPYASQPDIIQIQLIFCFAGQAPYPLPYGSAAQWAAHLLTCGRLLGRTRQPHQGRGGKGRRWRPPSQPVRESLFVSCCLWPLHAPSLGWRVCVLCFLPPPHTLRNHPGTHFFPPSLVQLSKGGRQEEKRYSSTQLRPLGTHVPGSHSLSQVTPQKAAAAVLSHNRWNTAAAVLQKIENLVKGGK